MQARYGECHLECVSGFVPLCSCSAVSHEDVPLQPRQEVTQHIGAGDPSHAFESRLQKPGLSRETAVHVRLQAHHILQSACGLSFWENLQPEW